MVIRVRKRKINVNQLLKQIKILKAANRKLRTKNLNNYQSNYQCCPKSIYSNYDKTQLNKKLKKFIRKKHFAKKFTKLLRKLNDSKKLPKQRPKKHVNTIMTNEIGNNIDETKFFNGVEKSIDNINNTWPSKKIKTLKDELENIDYSKFYFDEPLMDLKKDSIFDLLFNDPGKYKRNSKDIKILEIKNCTEVPLITGIKFIDPIQNKEVIFNKKFIIKKITSNIGVLNAYYKMIQKFTDVKHIELKELIKKISDMINTTRIYFCDLPNNTCGITISNGNIYVSGAYLYEALGKTKEYQSLKKKDDKLYYKYTAICKIYLTLLHEFAHKLHYVIRRKQTKNSWKNNFFDHSEEINTENKLEYYINLNSNNFRVQSENEYKSIHNNNDLDESGDFFDRELYLGESLLEVNKDICEFFLFSRCSTYSGYIRKLQNLKKNIYNSIRFSNSRFKIILNRARCHFSIIRHKY